MAAARPARRFPAQEQRKIPAGQSLRRSRVVGLIAIAVVAAAGLAPAVLALLGVQAVALAFVLCLTAGLGVDGVRALCNARGQWRPLTEHKRYLTARTWTGPRTVDLSELRSVRARRIAGRFGKLDYVIVRDSAGVCMAFSEPADLRLLRAAVAASISQPSSAGPQVSRLASAVLGISRLPRGLSPLWSLASIELTMAQISAFLIPALMLSGK